MNSKPVESLVNTALTHNKIKKSNYLLNNEQRRFRSVAQSLVYLIVNIRPDICVAMSMLGACVE